MSITVAVIDTFVVTGTLTYRLAIDANIGCAQYPSDCQRPLGGGRFTDTL